MAGARKVFAIYHGFLGAGGTPERVEQKKQNSFLLFWNLQAAWAIRLKLMRLTVKNPKGSGATLGLSRALIHAAVVPQKPRARVIGALLGSPCPLVKHRGLAFGEPERLTKAATKQVTGVRGAVGLLP